MDQVYLGVLPAHEPLHDYLSGLLGLDGAVFDSYRLHPQMLMVRYQERTSQRELACKFFGRKLPSEGETPDDAHFRKLLLKEEGALRRFQALGFDQPPYRVPSILGQNEELEFLLVEEFVDGPHLDHFLRGAYKQLQDRAPLQASLRQLANFLSQLHQRGQEGEVSQEYALSPLAKYIEHLKERELADAAMLERLREALKGWQGLACWRAAPAAWLHGDCTPINFIFVGEDDMVIIDLERCHRGDPMRDLGSLEAELRLASISMARDPRACQPEIQVLQEAYGLDAGQQERLQFWVGTYLVRISRNDWHQEGQRLQILEEALSCLSRKPCSLTSTTP